MSSEINLSGWVLVAGYSIPLTYQRFEFYMIDGYNTLNLVMSRYVDRVSGVGLHWVQGRPDVMFKAKEPSSWPVICNYTREGDPNNVTVRL